MSDRKSGTALHRSTIDALFARAAANESLEDVVRRLLGLDPIRRNRPGRRPKTEQEAYRTE